MGPDAASPPLDPGQGRRRLADHHVGTILDHFGLTAGVLLREIGLTPERLAELARHALAWALPNVLLGALIIVPIWFVAYLFRPPGQRSD